MQVIAILLTLIATAFCAGGSTQTIWKVKNPTTGIPCILLYGQIDLSLNYYVGSTEAESDGVIHVPASSTVDDSQSYCDTLVTIKTSNSTVSVPTQIIHLTMDHMPGWWIRFYFTTDPRLPTNDGKQWALYRTEVTANYAATPQTFPNPDEPTHTYSSAVNINGDTMIADYVFADLSSSLYCPSAQRYLMNDDTKLGPRWTMTLSNLRVQAYATQPYTGSTPFGPKEICPTDQHVTDKVPIIVGGSLAGLIILVTILYLIYRAFLPESVITLVNPASHFENKAMTIEDEESEIGTSKSDSLHL